MSAREPNWTVLDYTDVVPGSGAAKLADSQVAPLVAQARGYGSVDSTDGVKSVVSEVRVGEPVKVTNRLKMMIRGGEDFMVIPWFRVDRVLENGASAVASSTQVRPSMPLQNRDGKYAKYEMLSGTGSPIDLHPGVPADWAAHATTFLITEGVVKGDAALTAQILAAGVDPKSLAADANLDTAQARVKLQTILEQVSAARRVPILSIVGVGNWHQNTEWNALSLKDRDVLVAFDGDLRKNRMVWSQADRLWKFIADSKHGSPKLIDLGGIDAEAQKAAAGLPADTKLGLDDYLAKVGDWSDVLTLVETELPPQPERVTEAKIGEARVSEDGTSVLAYRKVETFDGSSRTEWYEAVPIGGRVREVSSLRVLNDTAVRKGIVSAGSVTDSVRGGCVIELSWIDEPTGNKVTRTVTGPRVILETPPAEWSRKGANIHADIQRIPDWPPKGKEGDQFLRAIKANRMEEQNVRNGWDTMGYVPTESGHAAFVVGEQTLGRTKQDERDNRPGVTEEIMPMASSYGVADTYWSFVDNDDLDGWKAQIAADFRVVMEHFIVDSPWTDPAIGAVALLSALRPTCPDDTRLNIWISGGPGSGKTWAAGFMMGFWHCEPGTWSVDNLPGQASDTLASREHSMARTPIFVVDDLAPSVSRIESERQEAAIDQSIRARHNGAGKRRATVDGDQRSVAHPRAVMVHTAENRREVLSIIQRIINIKLSRSIVVSDRGVALEKLTQHPDNPMGRLTAAMIRLWLNVDLTETGMPYTVKGTNDELLDTWDEKRLLAARTVRWYEKWVQSWLEKDYAIDLGSSARRASMFAELFMTMQALMCLGDWAGVPADDPAMAPFHAPMKDRLSIQGSLIRMAAEDMRELRGNSVASRLMSAIRLLLETGKAHLESPTLSGTKPIVDGDDADWYNRAAGWSFDARSSTWLPQGTSIGYVGFPPGATDADELVAHLNATEAFRLAQQFYPSLVPSGQKGSDSWAQVWEHESGALISPAYRARPRENSVKARLGSAAGETSGRLGRGIPVLFSALLGDDESSE